MPRRGQRRAAGGGTASASQLGRERSSPAASDPSSSPTTQPRPILRDSPIDPSHRSRDKDWLSRGGVPARVPLGSPTTAGRAGASWVSGPTVYWTPPRDSSPPARRRRITLTLSRALCRSPYRFVAWLAGSRSPPRRLRTALPLGRESAAHRRGFAIDNLQQRACRAVRHPPLLLPIAQRREFERERFRELLLRQAKLGANRLDVGRDHDADFGIVERAIQLGRSVRFAAICAAISSSVSASMAAQSGSCFFAAVGDFGRLVDIPS